MSFKYHFHKVVSFYSNWKEVYISIFLTLQMSFKYHFHKVVSFYSNWKKNYVGASRKDTFKAVCDKGKI